MQELDNFSAMITIGDEECPFDPERQVALVMCENCSNQEEVEVVALESGRGTVYGFLCTRCGHFNQPCD